MSKIQSFVDAARVVKEGDFLPQDQRFTVLKKEIFRGRNVEKIEPPEVFNTILEQLQTISADSAELLQNESLRSNAIQSLIGLKVFSEGYFANHKELDMSLSEKVTQSFSETIANIEKLSEKNTASGEAKSAGNEAEKAIETLRATTEEMQSASKYEEILNSTLKAGEANANLVGASNELRNRADNFNLAIQEKVHSFLHKEVTQLKTELNESKDKNKIGDLKGRLQKYEDLADFTGSHKEHIKDQISDLFHNMGGS